MKLVHAYLKHAENKRFSKKQFPCLFPYIYIFCSRFHSGLCYSMIPCLFLPPLCFLVWLKAPVYLPQWLLCLLLQPCFTVTCIFTQITGSCCSILLNNKCCHKKQYHTFANFKQFHRLPLYICMSLSFYTEISFKWRLKTGTIEHLCFEPSFSWPWHNMPGYKKNQEGHDLLKHHKTVVRQRTTWLFFLV